MPYLVTISYRPIKNHLVSQTYSFEDIAHVNKCVATWRSVHYCQSISVVEVMENFDVRTGRQHGQVSKAVSTEDTLRVGSGGLDVGHGAYREACVSTPVYAGVHRESLEPALRKLVGSFARLKLFS